MHFKFPTVNLRICQQKDDGRLCSHTKEVELKWNYSTIMNKFNIIYMLMRQLFGGYQMSQVSINCTYYACHNQ